MSEPDHPTPQEAAAAGPLEGSALVRASFPYMEEDLRVSYALLIVTIAVLATATGIALWRALPLWMNMIGSFIAGLTWIRAFIFFHDTRHGAMFRDAPIGLRICDLFGVMLLCPPSVWQETHDYHHRNNAKIVGASIGSFPVATPLMWRMMTPSQRRAYRFVRSPLNMLIAYFTVFIVGMCMSPFIRQPRQHIGGPLTLLFHFALYAVLWALGGWHAALLGVILPIMMATTLGAYLFYAQHNFPDAWVADRRDWNYHQAALKSSSMFDMHPLLHWFTGNIGYHHVHHLNHRIPFYRLPEAMAAIPELQAPGRTSWWPSDIAACFACKLWDPKAGRYAGWQT